MKINQLCLSRSGQEILQNITVELPDTGVVVLLGANGAGKSSLLQVMAGLLSPDSGQLNFSPDHSCYLLPEPAVFYPYLSVKEQLQFVAQQMRVAAVDIEPVMERWGLTAMANRLTRHLSLGFRQRLSLAQLDVSAASMLLMDEPLNGMDPQVMQAFMQQVQAWKTQKSIIMATHIMQDMESLADWVVVMHQGELVTLRRHTDGDSFHNIYNQAINDWQASGDVMDDGR